MSPSMEEDRLDSSPLSRYHHLVRPGSASAFGYAPGVQFFPAAPGCAPRASCWYRGMATIVRRAFASSCTARNSGSSSFQAIHQPRQIVGIGQPTAVVSSPLDAVDEPHPLEFGDVPLHLPRAEPQALTHGFFSPGRASGRSPTSNLALNVVLARGRAARIPDWESGAPAYDKLAAATCRRTAAAIRLAEIP